MRAVKNANGSSEQERRPARRGFLQSAIMIGLGILAFRTPARAVSEGPGEDSGEGSDRSDLVTLFLTGDVMTGRGIDQVLPHPGDARLYEPYVKSSLEYVSLAETANGPTPKPVDFAYVWGDALAELEARRPDLRLINLETAVTTSAEPEIKGINYKMNPENAPVLTAAGVDCCVLANNHVLDWGAAGLLETLKTLEEAGVIGVGAGRDLREAAAPAVLPVGSKVRVLVLSFGSPTSGIPHSWAATEERPGVNLLPDLSPGTIHRIAQQVSAVKRPGDVIVASIHWGPNWGYEIPEQQVAFAHGLIDEAGVDVIHGHSSHHVKGIEVYRNRPILYGCGDFLDDYEGISGYEAFRNDLVLMYFLTMRASRGTLARLTMVPLQIRNFRLNRASPTDAAWLRDTLNREGRRFGTSARLDADNALTLVWD
jgi:poly-gamma-glutamate synthesis protein (capsule biosynthesis protein)